MRSKRLKRASTRKKRRDVKLQVVGLVVGFVARRPLSLQNVERRQLREDARRIASSAKLRELQLKKRVGRAARRAALLRTLSLICPYDGEMR